MQYCELSFDSEGFADVGGDFAECEPSAPVTDTRAILDRYAAQARKYPLLTHAALVEYSRAVYAEHHRRLCCITQLPATIETLVSLNARRRRRDGGRHGRGQRNVWLNLRARAGPLEGYPDRRHANTTKRASSHRIAALVSARSRRRPQRRPWATRPGIDIRLPAMSLGDAFGGFLHLVAQILGAAPQLAPRYVAPVRREQDSE